jgi:molybdopterin/thiamine biosynthesis adenylyltransferase
MFDFSEEEINRYSRHIILPEVGGHGQKKIKNARVFMVGAGGLGSPCGYYLAAAGVGRIGIADSDVVDMSNLQRQILHSTADLGRPKSESAKETMTALNPEIEVITYQERLTSSNILDIIKDYDIVADGCDNFPTRYLVNDACIFLKKPLVSAAVFRFDGQLSTFIPHDGPCYRCLYETPPPRELVPSCQEAGVLGVLPGLLGVLQATEVLKYILNMGTLLKGQLLIINVLDMSFQRVKVPRNPACPVCGENPTITELIDYEQACQAAG